MRQRVAEPIRIAVLLSGAGSNLAALAAYVQHHADLRLDHVITDQPSAGGVARAQVLGIPTTVCPRADGQSRDEHDADVQAALSARTPDVVVLAGYMRILGADFVRAWHGKMLNVHPSLLPKYKGLHTYRRALADGERWHGSSVHFVTETLDGGPVIAQARVAVLGDETEDTLRARTQLAEHILYPLVVAAVARKHVVLARDGVTWHGTPLTEPLTPDELGHAAMQRHG